MEVPHRRGGYSKLGSSQSKMFISWTKNETKNKRASSSLKLVTIAANVIGEFLGTFILTLVIISAVSSAVLSSAQSGIWQVAIVCGVGVSLSIFCTSFICDAHLNPAITVAFAIFRFRSFPWTKVLPYCAFQMLGGVMAGTVLYYFANEKISFYEEKNGIQRGTNDSVITAMMFGEYFPNPALFSYNDPQTFNLVSLFKAFAVEVWTTAILSLVIFSCTNEANVGVGPKGNRVVVPIAIGLTVAVLISIYGPYNQVGMNPARDFGPRLVALCAGWGVVAVPGPKYGFWTYIVGPILGAIAGAAMSDLVLSGLARTIKKWKMNSEDASDSKDLKSPLELENASDSKDLDSPVELTPVANMGVATREKKESKV